jgi:beta-phosphoglucomutase-like phosphatase (HAD superfamily)
MLEAIFFDCDGVLVDTEHLKFQAWNSALESYSISISKDDYSDLVGHSSAAIIRKLEILGGVELNPQETILRKEAIYKRLHAQGIRKITRHVKLLDKLIDMRMKGCCNFKIGVVSSDSLQNIRANLRAAKVPVAALDVVVSGLDHLPEGLNKPHPAIYMEAARRTGVNPKGCVVLEDTPAGCISAGKSGMCVIAVPNSYTRNLEFPLAHAIVTSEQGELTVNSLFRYYHTFSNGRILALAKESA